MTDVQPKTSTECPCAGSAAGDHAASRRAVLVGVGAVGATAVLAACGTSTPTSTGPAANPPGVDKPIPAGSANPGTGSGSGSSGGSGGKTLVAVADVPNGGGVIKGNWVITQPAEGTFKAFSKVCTHAGCDVNKIDGGTINCPCHGSKFSIEDGSVKGGPAPTGLKELKVKVDGDNVVTA